ncbi:carboxypeptidase-like regulatory domain-containing protein [Paenibacillus thiaminolyticus]|uniref:Carboxypeptidase regulatory-like domain-containing protein n=1 Tax=Paenibacillus thiaminolyticus TaxID=49283 RepID=A0A3A3GDF9_PANTH|nr:carboxypeptidase-like regulatory domain-containing protein [Paenibacillus thiaminolyticus]RJG15097.1 hypothetical protein DQX05_30005 [Paenibacillus thiaminolyticus]
MIRLKVRHLTIILAVLAALSGLSWIVPRIAAEPHGFWLSFLGHGDDTANERYFALMGSHLPARENLLYIGKNSSSFSTEGSEDREMSVGEMKQQSEQFLRDYPDHANASLVRSRLGNIYMLEKRWDEAERVYKDLSRSDTWDHLYRDQLMLLESRVPKPGEKPMLSGTVIRGQQPLEGAIVVLRQADANSWYSPPRPDIYPMAMTDENGEFRFYQVPEQTYDIEIGAPLRELDYYTYAETSPDSIVLKHGQSVEGIVIQLNPNLTVLEPQGPVTVDGDAITMRWEAYPGAAYYVVQWMEPHQSRTGKSRGAATHVLPGKHAGTEATYRLSELREYGAVGGGMNWSPDEGVWIYPSYLLGIGYPGAQYVWSVDAYDDQDRKISSSRLYAIVDQRELPLIRIPDGPLSDGDQYVLQAEYESAKRAYMEEGNKRHALRVLARMEMFGTTKDASGDEKKALYYLKKIDHPVLSDLKMMELCYSRLNMEDEAERIRRQMERLEGGRASSSDD